MMEKKIKVQVSGHSYRLGSVEKTTKIESPEKFKDTFRELLGRIKEKKGNWNWTWETEIEPNRTENRWKEIPCYFKMYPEISKQILSDFSKFVPSGADEIEEVKILICEEEELI